MRAIGHFVVFIAFFLLFSLIMGLVVLGAVAMRSTLVLLAVVPTLPGLYLVYSRGYRALTSRAAAQR